MRYLPLTAADRATMLARAGVASVDELFADVPAEARLKGLLDLPAGQGEMAVERALAALAAENRATDNLAAFIGAGAYRHHLPASVDHLIQRSEFLTAYTPYQPEVSQGTLQFLFEFQTQVALLSGLDVANASLYDGSTATAEAILMAGRVTRRRRAVVSGGLHPHYRDVVEASCQFIDLDIDFADPDPRADEDLAALVDSDIACVVVQYPDFFGRIRDFAPLAATCHEAGALLVVVVTEAVSFGALKSPGEMGADIVAAEGQSLGNPLGFGGPYLGLLAVRDKHVRQMPGRLVGESVDADGRRAFTLTLATREQHIRRDKATSNICTNSGLCALAFCIHLTLLGEDGLRRLARLNHATAVRLAGRLAEVPGVEVLNHRFFNEFTVDLGQPAAAVVEALAERGVLAGVPLSRLYPDRESLANLAVVAATETNTPDEIEVFAETLAEELT
jgi:glycine dehydrogenase subunit 1